MSYSFSQGNNFIKSIKQHQKPARVSQATDGLFGLIITHFYMGIESFSQFFSILGPDLVISSA